MDLPGVVGGHVENEPANMDKLTQQLVRDHLRDNPDALVLIVLEATASSIRNSPAFALVTEAEMVDVALGVLTKADGCTGPSLARLQKRLRGAAPDLPKLGLEEVRPNELRKDYVALVNRDSADGAKQQSIAQAEKAEGDWFDKNMADLKPFHGGKVLVQKLAAKLLERIKTWAPGALKKLKDALADFEVRVATVTVLGLRWEGTRTAV